MHRWPAESNPRGAKTISVFFFMRTNISRRLIYSLTYHYTIPSRPQQIIHPIKTGMNVVML